MIDQLIQSLKTGKEQFDFIDQGSLKDYLGVQVDKLPNGSLTLSQPHLIHRLLDLLGIKEVDKSTSDVKPRDTRKHTWHYHQVIGMLN